MKSKCSSYDNNCVMRLKPKYFWLWHLLHNCCRKLFSTFGVEQYDSSSSYMNGRSNYKFNYLDLYHCIPSVLNHYDIYYIIILEIYSIVVLEFSDVIVYSFIWMVDFTMNLTSKINHYNVREENIILLYFEYWIIIQWLCSIIKMR